MTEKHRQIAPTLRIICKEILKQFNLLIGTINIFEIRLIEAR